MEVVMKLHKKYVYLLGFAVSLAVFSCTSVPKDQDVPPDATPADIIQKAQESVDKNDYQSAHAYYHIMLNRFAEQPAVCVVAEYEIAHLHIKKYQWQQAYALLEKIIHQYEENTNIYLPPEYYKLAKIDYERAKQKLHK